MLRGVRYHPCPWTVFIVLIVMITSPALFYIGFSNDCFHSRTADAFVLPVLRIRTTQQDRALGSSSSSRRRSQSVLGLSSVSVFSNSTVVDSMNDNGSQMMNFDNSFRGNAMLEAATPRQQDSATLSTQHQKTFTPVQSLMRALPLATALWYAISPEPLDDAVAGVWSWIYNWDVAQNPLFEAEVASFSFVAWIAGFSALHLVLGPDRTRSSRFDGQMPHDPFEWTRFENWHLWFNPLFAYLGSIWLWLQIHEKPPMPEVAPTFGVLSVELVFGVWLYDLCFFPIHYLLHRKDVLGGKFRRLHAYHHRSGQTTMNALETVQHSYWDGFLQVFVNICVQQISPFAFLPGHHPGKHVMSRLLHNITVTYLLSEAHSGYRSLPWMSHNVFPELLGGSPRHEQHHASGRVYYQQYFKYLDDFFGFTEEGQQQQFWEKS